jgi:glutathione S-transferase
MADIILHHYWESPYAEKIRRIFGFKKAAWKSVIIPMVAPKPDLTELTGGYRKTPVMQIGADIFCDSDRIARKLEELFPEPSLFPPGSEALGQMITPWQQELFMMAVQLVGATSDIFPEGFVEDRATMFDGGFDLEKMLNELPATRDRLRSKLELMESHFGDGRDFVLGDRASLADFSLNHPVFALHANPGTTELLAPFPRVRKWMERIDAFGHGEMTEIAASEAIAAAREVEPAARAQSDADDPNGRKPGDRVSVVHESFGRDPTFGEIVASSAQEIVVRRRGDRVGEVVVHFPREHYLVLPASP